MSKQLLIAVFFMGLGLSLAQEGTTSPYSFNGIGELKFRGTVENRTMGGIQVYADSTSINLQNPASLGYLRYTVYTLGVNYTSLTIKGGGESDNSATASVDYLALAFPVTKRLALSFGLVPVSSVGYRLEASDTESDPAFVDQYTGSGGLNRLFLAGGFRVFNGLTAGISANYNFGNIQNDVVRRQEDIQYGTALNYRSDLSGFEYTLGLNYRHSLNNRMDLYTSLAFSPEVNLTSENSGAFGTFPVVGTSNNIVFEPLELGELAVTELTLPAFFTIGAGIGKENKWFVGADFTNKQTADFQQRLFQNSSIEYINGYKFSLGGYYIPKWDSFTSYWSKIVLRAGIRVEKTGLRIGSEDINDFGMTVGAGLPLFRGSYLNLGFEYGTRGTENNGLIKENYFNLRLGITLKDKWFQKIRYQ